MWRVRCFIAVVLIASVLALDNGLGLTPPMGWNSWNHFGCDISEDVIRQTADAMVAKGLLAAGYNYLNLDDCVFVDRDPTTYVLMADPKKFPSGIKALGDYVHSKGLKFGIYTDAGHRTCAGRPGIYGYEKIDADTFASMGVDYLKVDWCNTEGMKPKDRYAMIGKALNLTGRPIFYSMCDWGVDSPWLWAGPIANSWRTTGDISDSWSSVTGILQKMEGLGKYAKIGAWNDPDMLEVGNGKMTEREYQSHFSLWAIMNSPLLIGCDVRSIDSSSLATLTNAEVIAVSQDKMGVAGDIVQKEIGVIQVWSKPLSGNRWAAVLLNESPFAGFIHARWKEIGIPAGTKCKIRDLWSHKDLGIFTDDWDTEVLSHGVMMISLTPVK